MTAPEGHPVVLENQYRRLIGWWPERQRLEYGDELLGVLLADARPGQRRPRLGESADLVLTAVRLRLGRFAHGIVDRRWAEACAVFGLLGSVALWLLAVRPVVMAAAWSARVPFVARPSVTPFGWLWIGGWTAVVVAALAGRRLAAAPLAWVGAVAVACWIGVHDPVPALYGWRTLVLTVSVAAALSVRTKRARDPRSIALLGVAAGAVLVLPLLDPLLARVARLDDGGWSVDASIIGGSLFPGLDPLVGSRLGTGLFGVIAALVALVTGAMFIRRVRADIRRRVIALAAAPLSVAVAIWYGFGGLIASSPRFDPPVQLVWEQWTVLVLLPPIVAAAGIVTVHRLDRRAELIALGREAERRAGEPQVASASPERPTQP